MGVLRGWTHGLREIVNVDGGTRSWAFVVLADLAAASL